MNKEPKSEFARYAYGYSDKKPSLAFWIVFAFVVIVCIIGITTIHV